MVRKVLKCLLIKTVMFRYWITGEPNHLMDEDCVEIQPDWSSQGNWNDFPCEEKKHYICEYEYEMLNF